MAGGIGIYHVTPMSWQVGRNSWPAVAVQACAIRCGLLGLVPGSNGVLCLADSHHNLGVELSLLCL